MTYVRVSNQFRDPAGVVPDWNWQINHTAEQAAQITRQMGLGAPTAGLGLIPQQGTPTGITFQWKGTFYTQEERDNMNVWYLLCNHHTIYLRDFASNTYEVLITDLSITRRAVGWNRRGGIPYLWDYDISIYVVHAISGEWVGMTA